MLLFSRVLTKKWKKCEYLAEFYLKSGKKWVLTKSGKKC